MEISKWVALVKVRMIAVPLPANLIMTAPAAAKLEGAPERAESAHVPRPSGTRARSSQMAISAGSKRMR